VEQGTIVAIVITVLNLIGWGISSYYGRDRKVTEKEIEKHEKRIEKLEVQYVSLLANLPIEYVRREDWIRNMVSFDYKLEEIRKYTEELRAFIIGGNRDEGFKA
jgi:hypothetical protein